MRGNLVKMYALTGLWVKLNRIGGIGLFCSMKPVMKKTIILAVMGLLAWTAEGQSRLDFGSKARIYIVRHAEKYTGKDAGRDPILIAAGFQRAGDLMRYLKEKKIGRIYCTPYKRSGMTADSLRIQLGIDTVQYKADTLFDDLVRKIVLNDDLNKRILIIGHSNTLARLIRKMGVAHYPQKDIPDHQYDDLFLVRKKGKRMVVRNYKYGQKSVPTEVPTMR